MANIMSQLKLRNKPSRNGFDLSKKNAFTAKVGELLPVYCKEVLPGDKFNINAKWLSRTMPVNTAAYTRIREYYDFFFVPTTLLWNRFGTFVTNMLDNQQRATSIAGNGAMLDKQPYFTANDLFTYTRPEVSPNNQFHFSRGVLSRKLLHYLGYGDYTQSPLVNAELNPFPLLAYQKIYQDYFRNQQWEKAAPQTYNVDYLTGSTSDSMRIPLASMDTTSLNMLDLRYCNWNKDYFTGLLPNSQYGDAASVNSDTLTGDLILDIGPSSQYSTPLLLSPSTSGLPSSGNPLTVKGVSQTSNNYSIGTSETSLANIQLSAYAVEQLRSSLGLTSSSTGTASVQSFFTILALRQAQAKQKWAEITQSQRHDYKSQVNAHFGVSMSDAYSDYSNYLGGVNGNIDISEVVNTNITGDNESDVAGKGVGVGQGGINFEAKTHGYIMCIYHAMPLLDYSITGIKRQNLKTTFMDYAQPEFDATGMVQVPAVELINSQLNNLSTGALLGYAPRYIDYKTDYDEVHGAFYNGGLQAWVAPFDDSYIQNYINLIGSSFKSLDYRFFKVSPSVVNPIFGVDATADTSTDQLLVNAYFDVKAVRNLDVNGLPY